MMAAGRLVAYLGPAAMLGCDWRPAAGLTLRTTYMRFAPPRTNEPELTKRMPATRFFSSVIVRVFPSSSRRTEAPGI